MYKFTSHVHNNKHNADIGKLPKLSIMLIKQALCSFIQQNACLSLKYQHFAYCLSSPEVL